MPLPERQPRSQTHEVLGRLAGSQGGWFQHWEKSRVGTQINTFWILHGHLDPAHLHGVISQLQQKPVTCCIQSLKEESANSGEDTSKTHHSRCCLIKTLPLKDEHLACAQVRGFQLPSFLPEFVSDLR